MAYRLDLQADLKPELRRAILKELARSVTAEAPSTAGIDVFTTRKAFKRARALLRLARTSTNRHAVRALDLAIRATAHGLAETRDHDARLEVFDRLLARPKALAPAALVTIHAALQRHAPRVVHLALFVPKLRASVADLQDRAERLPLKGLSRKTLIEGAGDTYRRARRRMAKAAAAATAEAFHDWRKDAQRHVRHMQLLRDLWPTEMAVRIDAGRALTALLGADSDLDMLATWLKSADLEPRLKATALAQITKQQARIRLDTLAAGRRLFAESARAFTKRLQRYGQGFDEQIGDGVQEISADASSPLVPNVRIL